MACHQIFKWASGVKGTVRADSQRETQWRRWRVIKQRRSRESSGYRIPASCLIVSWQQKQACSQRINPPIFIYLLQVLMKQFPCWIIIFPLHTCQGSEREMKAAPNPLTHLHTHPSHQSHKQLPRLSLCVRSRVDLHCISICTIIQEVENDLHSTLNGYRPHRSECINLHE